VECLFRERGRDERGTRREEERERKGERERERERESTVRGGMCICARVRHHHPPVYFEALVKQYERENT
jgi:hypothetical protein